MRESNGSYPAIAVFGWLALGLTGQSIAVETLKLEVRETAGIGRFGYPVALALPELSSGASNGRFRLRDGDKVVAAQFRQDHIDAGAWRVDFNVSMTPHEVRSLTLEYGPDVEANSEPRGLELKQTPDGFEVRNGPHLTWTVGRNLLGLLKSVDAGGLQHLRPEGARLGIEGPNGVLYKMDDDSVSHRIMRSGPLAIAIRYELAPTIGPLANLKSTIDLTFPVSKSWVQVDWRIDDPRQAVRSARAEIAQNLDSPTGKEPTLVDFGASSLVYMSLAPGTAGRLQSLASAPEKGLMGQYWEVLRGARNRLEPFVVRTAGSQSGDAEGWAHSMDRKRCLALAVGDFGKGSDDSIEINADGNVTVARQFAAGGSDPPATKTFRFWLHFVGFPPHLTAATSPQSMLSPLIVRVSKP